VEIPGAYAGNFLEGFVGAHERQHDRFTVSDRECKAGVLRFAIEPLKDAAFSLRRWN
jgi:hypothetical protein